MDKKQKRILFISISLSMLLGIFLAFINFEEYEHNNHSLAISSEINSLEEELAYADLIIKGTVEKEIDTFKQDAGVDTPLGPMEFNVTTYEVKVDEVLQGELESDKITFYQHGSSKIPSESRNHVKENEQVYLILTKRTDGKGYWSYNFDDGIWKIKENENVVESDTESPFLKSLDNKDSEYFESTIVEAIKN